MFSILRRARPVWVVLTLMACAAPAPPATAFTPFAGREVGLSSRAAQIRRAATGLGWNARDAQAGRLTFERADGSRASVTFTQRSFVLDGAGEAAAELRRSIVAQSGV